MRFFRGVAASVAFAVVLGACGQISGLTGFSESEPTANAGADASVTHHTSSPDATAMPDAPAPSDATGEQGTDAAVDEDGALESGDGGASEDGGDEETDATSSADAPEPDAADAAGEAAQAGCGGGSIECDGGCVDPSSALHCGTCGNSCSGATPVCAASGETYACGSGCPSTTPTPCGGSCVDVQTDVNNCGGCGAAFACASGQTCSSGRCFGCGTSCPSSTVAAYSCPKGGCNAAGGACTAAAEGCYCTNDDQCASGKCVMVSGQNNASCGSSCTGSGAADGMDCELVANGIPSSCTEGFGYVPSNFVPGSVTPVAPVTIPGTCTTLAFVSSSTGGTWTSTCGLTGLPAPALGAVPAAPAATPVVLAFSGLTMSSGSILRLTGTQPVILAVYGNATIAGTINASGTAGAQTGDSTAGAAGAPGAGGNENCTTGAGGTASDARGGGGGGGMAVAGGGGGTPSPVGAGGAARGGSNAAVPLLGGCPGGNSGTECPAGVGAGGGAVQISVAGTLTLTGSVINTSGGTGAAGQKEGNTCSCGGCSGSWTGGGGGGSAGDILLEGVTVAGGTQTATGGTGGANGSGGAGGAGGTATVNGTTGTAPGAGNSGGNNGGGGGGGSGGFVKIRTGLPATAYTCTTSLSPAPACNSAHTACLCVADTDCPSSKCSNVTSQCGSNICTGSTMTGAYDAVDCALITSAASAWSCSAGTCDNVASPSGTCSSAGVPCWCTGDSQCSGGLCVNWAGCPAGACTGTATPDALNCVP
jgi:hypothetical protein